MTEPTLTEEELSTREALRRMAGALEAVEDAQSRLGDAMAHLSVLKGCGDEWSKVAKVCELTAELGYLLETRSKNSTVELADISRVFFLGKLRNTGNGR